MDQQGRILLEEEDIGLYFAEAAHKLAEFFLLAEEGELVEGTVDIQVEFWGVLDELIEVVFFEGVGQEGVEEDEIVETRGVAFGLAVLYSLGGWEVVEDIVPALFELLSVHEGIVADADVRGEGWTVPASAYLLVDFAHVPGEVLGVKIWVVLRDDFEEDLADGLQFLGVVLAVELEGVVHDVAVVEGGRYDPPLLHRL